VKNTIVEQDVAADHLGGLVARDIRDRNDAIRILDDDVLALFSGQVQGATRGQVGGVVDTVDDVVAENILNLRRIQVGNISLGEGFVIRSEDGDAFLSNALGW